MKLHILPQHLSLFIFFLYTTNLSHISIHYRFYSCKGQVEALQGALAWFHGAFALFKLVLSDISDIFTLEE